MSRIRFTNKTFAPELWVSFFVPFFLILPSDVSLKGKHNAASHNYRVRTTSLPNSMCLLAGLCFDHTDRPVRIKCGGTQAAK